MTRRTVLLVIGLLCCWSGQAVAQTVDTTVEGTLSEQTSSVTQQVTTPTQELEPVTSQVLGSGGSGGGGSSSGSSSSGESSSSGDGDAAEPCETKPAGGSQGSGTGGGGGGASDPGGQLAATASGPDGAFVAEREQVDETDGGVLGEAAGEGSAMGDGDESETLRPPLAPPDPEEEVPFWGGLALLVVLGFGFAGFVAALTSHVLGRTRAD